MPSTYSPKIEKLKKFLLDESSEEYVIYANFILQGLSRRPEDEFIDRHLGHDFWRELGFDESEIGSEHSAGHGAMRVEISLMVDEQKIAVECKKPYAKNGDRIYPHPLDGDDPDELRQQIGPYLSTHDYVIFTNGHDWYFYSRASYLAWNTIGSNSQSVKPYFHHFKSNEIFNDDENNIRNWLARENILESIHSMEERAPRHQITDEFFKDLKTWIDVIDESLQNTPANAKARTTSLINKLIFVRTMEGVNIISNGFLASKWDNTNNQRLPTVALIDSIDDELSDVYNTELFTSKYMENSDGKLFLENGIAKFNPERQKNFAYQNIPKKFFDAILKKRDQQNVGDSGYTIVEVNKKKFSVRSLYWWRFEAISADVLGKAYETYLARTRKKLGIYYTPHEMTNFLNKKTVSLVFDEKISSLEEELKKDDWDLGVIKQTTKKIEDIRICDPSCGSGSFLIQTIRLLWKKYAQICDIIQSASDRYGSSAQTLSSFSTEKAGLLEYLKLSFKIQNEQERMGILILRHIHGNDKDANAIDTAKLNIWLECIRVAPNAFRFNNLRNKKHVLPNLSLNLSVGDALIGLNAEKTSTCLDQQRSAIASIFGMRRRYSEKFDITSFAYDAAKIRDGINDFVDLEFSEEIKSPGMNAFLPVFQKQIILELVKDLNPTHWALAHFSAYFNEDGTLKEKDDQGFDVILGNPPWETLKPNDDEFFSDEYNQDDLTLFRKLNTGEKERIKTKLLTDSARNIRYEKYKNEINLQRQYYGETNEYGLQRGTTTQQRGIDAELSKFFIERYYNLLKKDGIAGVVLPLGFLLHLGALGLRHLLLNKTEIKTLFVFENYRKRFFSDVHAQTRFMNLVFQKGGKTETFDNSFRMRETDFLLKDKVPIRYDVNILEKTSPGTLAILEFRDQKDFELIRKLYSKYPLINENQSDEWRVVFQREFHMTQNRNLFNENQEGWVLYEGKTINQFDNHFDSSKGGTDVRYWIKKNEGRDELARLQAGRISSSSTATNPDIKIDCDYYRLGWRDITNAVDKRTIYSTILPPNAFLSQTISYMRPNFFNGREFQPALNLKETVCLCGLFNSLVIDFIIRHRVSLHATMSIVNEIPVPRLKEGDKYFSEIVQCVGNLICITPEYDELKTEIGISSGVTDEGKREDITAELNVYVAKLFDLNEKELEYILGTFEQVEDSLKNKIRERWKNSI